MAAARPLRRQRNLSQIEIPEDNVTISDEILGKGGFGSVYIADYNGRNDAAKVSIPGTCAEHRKKIVILYIVGENPQPF